MRRLYFLFFFFLCFYNLKAQPGALDPDFLPNQIGEGECVDAIEGFRVAGLQAGGKVVGVDQNLNVSRMDTNGKRDPSFRCFYKISGAKKIFVFPDQRIWVIGLIQSGNQVPNLDNQQILALLPNGQLDTSFQYPFRLGQPPALRAPVFRNFFLQKNGRVVLCGNFLLKDTTLGRFACIRFLQNGQVDESFRKYTIQEIESPDFIAEGENNSLIFADQFSSPKPFKLKENGQIDSTFTFSGLSTGCLSLMAEANGDFFLINRNGNLLKYKANGNRDSNFQSPNQLDLNRILAVFPNGEVLVQENQRNVTQYFSKYRFFRFSATGQLLYQSPFSEFRTLRNTDFREILPFSQSQILVTGFFQSIWKKGRNGVAKLNQNGQVLPGYTWFCNGFPKINHFQRQKDGKIWIAGEFNQVFGKERLNLARLHPNGDLYTSFSCTSFFHGSSVKKIRVQPDGKILILCLDVYPDINDAGFFPLNSIFRFFPNGEMDSSFFFLSDSTFRYRILDFELQDDGKIVIAGKFNSTQFPNKPDVFRIFPNGNPDPGFNSLFPDKTLLGDPFDIQMALTPGQKIVLYSRFWSGWSSKWSDSLRCLLPNGQRDRNFKKIKGLKNDFVEGVLKIRKDGQIQLLRGKTTLDGIRPCIMLFDSLGNAIDTNTFIFPLSTYHSYGLQSLTDFHFQKDGKLIWIPTYINGNPDFVQRKLQDMRQDSSFIFENDVPTDYQYLGKLEPQEDGKLLVLANSDLSTPPFDKSTFARIFLNEENLPSSNRVSGMVYQQGDENCFPDSSELGIPNRLVKTEPGPYFSSTDQEGKYQFSLPDGSYQISQILPSYPQINLIENQVCPPEPNNFHAIQLQNDSIASLDFANKILDCPILKMSMGSGQSLHCKTNQTSIRVQNLGSKPSEIAELRLEVPRGVYISSTSLPFKTTWGDTIFDFELAPIPPFGEKTIYLLDSVSCQEKAIALCYKASLKYSNPCQVGNFSLPELKSGCSNGRPFFIIKNKHAEDIIHLSYRILKDSLLLSQKELALAGNDSLFLQIEENQPFAYRLEIIESANPVGNILAYKEVQCQGEIKFTPWFPASTWRFESQQLCKKTEAHETSNWKTAQPKGIGPNGFILPETPIEYTLLIKKENTRANTKIKIKEYLDEDFDLNSFQFIASSHPCQWKFSGLGKAILEFELGLDSQAQRGFVSFRISPKKGLPEGTRLHNLADIFMENQKPIRSNQTLHTVNSNLQEETENVFELPLGGDFEIELYPNPGFENPSLITNRKADMQVFNVLGQRVLEKKLVVGKNQIEVPFIRQGIYYFQIWEGRNKKTLKWVKY